MSAEKREGEAKFFGGWIFWKMLVLVLVVSVGRYKMDLFHEKGGIFWGDVRRI